MAVRTVFFGPWVGEFGWELLYWQGWVRGLARTIYKDARIVVASYPGRHPLYPDATEFWPHPAWLNARDFSAHGYITDYWRHGLPTGNVLVEKRNWLFRKRYERVAVGAGRPDAEPRVRALLDEYRRRLPSDTEWMLPFEHIRCPLHGVDVGVEIAARPRSNDDFHGHMIKPEHQLVEVLRPTVRGVDALRAMIPADRPLLSLFPRRRSDRRPDKNWSQAGYDALITLLRHEFPDHVVAILGEPGGAFYTDGVPAGTVDLVSVEPLHRTDLHLAALARSALAISSVSGAIWLSVGAGCPTLTFGFENQREPCRIHNYLGTPLHYHGDMNPKPETLLALARAMVVEGAAR